MFHLRLTNSAKTSLGRRFCSCVQTQPVCDERTLLVDGHLIPSYGLSSSFLAWSPHLVKYYDLRLYYGNERIFLPCHFIPTENHHNKSLLPYYIGALSVSYSGSGGTEGENM